jgi:hypothetical protein
MQPRSEAAVVEKRGSNAARRKVPNGSTLARIEKRVSSAVPLRGPNDSTPDRRAAIAKRGSNAGRKDPRARREATVKPASSAHHKGLPSTPVRLAATENRG